MRHPAILLVGLPVVALVGLMAWAVLRPPPILGIGLVGSQTGRFTSLGIDGRNGAILAVEELDRAGGILGRRLELDIVDDQGDGETCRQAFRELAARGRRIVLGPSATGPATAALDEINRLEVLTIAPTVAGGNLAGRDDWFIRLFPSTREMGLELGEMVAQDGVRRLALIGDSANGPFVETTVAGIRASSAAAAAGDPVTFDSRQHPPLSAVAAQAGDADGVLLMASSLDAAVLAQRLRERNPAVRLYSVSWAISAELLASGGKAVEGLRTVLPVAMHDQAWEAFASRYRDRFGSDPTHVSALHYEATRLLAAALAEAGSDDPATVRRILVSGAILTGAPPTIRLDRFGDPQRPLFRHRIVSGTLVADPKG